MRGRRRTEGAEIAPRFKVPPPCGRKSGPRGEGREEGGRREEGGSVIFKTMQMLLASSPSLLGWLPPEKREVKRGRRGGGEALAWHRRKEARRGQKKRKRGMEEGRKRVGEYLGQPSFPPSLACPFLLVRTIYDMLGRNSSVAGDGAAKKRVGEGTFQHGARGKM